MTFWIGVQVCVCACVARALKWVGPLTGTSRVLSRLAAAASQKKMKNLVAALFQLQHWRSVWASGSGVAEPTTFFYYSTIFHCTIFLLLYYLECAAFCVVRL